MDLWIRSQDKLHLEKTDYITVNGTDIFNQSHLLGTYETAERALEVLDEIQMALEYVEMVELNHKKEAAIGAVKIYEMPEE